MTIAICIIALVINIAVGSYLGVVKGRGEAGFWFGLLLGPIGWIILAAGPNIKNEAAEKERDALLRKIAGVEEAKHEPTSSVVLTPAPMPVSADSSPSESPEATWPFSAVVTAIVLGMCLFFAAIIASANDAANSNLMQTNAALLSRCASAESAAKAAIDQSASAAKAKIAAEMKAKSDLILIQSEIQRIREESVRTVAEARRALAIKKESVNMTTPVYQWELRRIAAAVEGRNEVLDRWDNLVARILNDRTE